MCRNLFYLTSFILVLGLTTHPAVAGIDYGEPDGGWTYIYTGDQALPDVTAALDGTWDHKSGSSGSDAWDGTAPGDSGTGGSGNAPGGAGIFTEGATTFLRLQDCGDPRDSGGDWSDPSNRKLTFAHDFGQDAGVDGSTILDDGVTISFRARIPTAGTLDPHYPNGGGGPLPWTTIRGYNIHDSGLGAFGIKQGTGGEGVISFSLCTADDEGISEAGLAMNKLNGNSPSGSVDYHGDESSVPENILTGFDPTEWHEFWITIQADTSGGGTHKVSIYMDGSGTATEFHVTAGDKDEYDFNGYICMSLGRTDIEGAQDVDFFAYKPGVITPTPSNPNLARALNPFHGATVALSDATPLSWTPGVTAAKHDVYFGTSQADVNDADASDTTGIYQGQQPLPIFNPPDALELGQTYYWRIDEVEANDTIHKGDVWSFTIRDHIPVDDMEGYNDTDKQIWALWHDGLGYWDLDMVFHPGNGTGAAVGDEENEVTFMEETIVGPGSTQSMPYFYDNNKPPDPDSGQTYSKYSEAKMTLDYPRDWTASGVKALSLMFIGFPEFLGGFTEGPAGTYTVTGAGEDIWNESDEFHFAYKELNGAGSIIAKVESVEDTHEWAKAGVMIRDTLDANSACAMVAVTPGNGISAQGRTATGGSSAELDNTGSGITAPYWVRLERTVGGAFRAYYSADGSPDSWTQLGSLTSIAMNLPMYVGLAVTSHESGVSCEAVFSNVTSDGTGPWIDEDIGITSNGAESMYVAISNNNGTTGTVYYDDNDNVDPNATLIDEWTEWNIDLKDFSDQGVDLTDVNDIAIGFGTKGNVTTPGPSGQIYIDNIRLYQPRYIADKVTPFEADFTGNGVVDYEDLQIVINDWLQGDYTIFATTPQPAFSWWKFDNNANDSAGSINGTPVGNPTYVAGNSGQAISLDGDDYIDFGNPSQLDFATGDWSVSAWIKTTMTGTGDENKGTIFAKGGDQTDGIRYTLAVSENTMGTVTLTTDDNDAKRQAISTSTVNDDAWHHVTGVRDGTTLQIYVDGTLEGTATAPDGYDLSGASQHNAYVGVITDNRDSSLIKPFVGLIDDVRIYDYALSMTEIMDVMGLSELYVPLTSQANISDEEPVNSKKVNFKDFAVLADQWLQELVWPSW
jgi:hypothetical protein